MSRFNESKNTKRKVNVEVNSIVNRGGRPKVYEGKGERFGCMLYNDNKERLEFLAEKEFKNNKSLAIGTIIEKYFSDMGYTDKDLEEWLNS